MNILTTNLLVVEINVDFVQDVGNSLASVIAESAHCFEVSKLISTIGDVVFITPFFAMSQFSSWRSR